MAPKNRFVYKSFFKEIERELEKDERRVLNKAAGLLQRQVRANIKSKGLVDEGDLLKGVKRDNYRHSVLVGMAPPAFHALIVEYGTEARKKKKGTKNDDSTKPSIMPATPYFLPAYQLKLPAIQKVFREEW